MKKLRHYHPMYTNALSTSTCKDVGHFFQKLLSGSTHRHRFDRVLWLGY